MRYRSVVPLAFAVIAACGDHTPADAGSGGAAGSGGSAGGGTATATATATSTGPGAGAGCERSEGPGGAPASVEEAWLDACVPVREIEACLGCAPQQCEELAAGFAASNAGCEVEAIALLGCLESVARFPEPSECTCGAEILECPFD